MTNKIHLTDVSWKEFFIGGEKGLFNIASTNSGIDKNKLNEKVGDIPYITRSALDNGINLFVTDEQDSKYKLNKGNVITIGLDTQTVFYQSNDFYTGQNIQVLENENLNKEIALFIIPLLRIQMKKFSWGGTGATLTRLNRTKIVLPVTDDGEVNWQFMENYIKQEQKEIAQNVINYYEQKMIQTGFDLIGLEDVEWKDFKISDLFETFKGTNGVQTPTGSYIPKDELIDSNIPRITARETNNGIDGYYHSLNKNFRVFNNFISVSFMGSAFYHSYEASLDMKVHALIPKNFDLTENIALFIIQSLKNNTKLFSYGNQLSSTDLPHQKILLPIDSNGNPHLEYIDTFIRKIKSGNIEKALQYIYIYI